MIRITKFQLGVSVFCLAMVVICSPYNPRDSADASWSRLQISPNELCSMPYKNFRIKIYGHSNNKRNDTISLRKKYFYTPLGILNHTSAESIVNNSQPKRFQLRFEIEMWNSEVEEAVVNYLQTFLNEPVKIHQAQVLPLEKIALKSKGISTSWSHYQLDQKVTFSLTCTTKLECDSLKTEMHESPMHFNHLRLLLSFSLQTSQARETVIKINNVRDGKMMSQLLQKFPKSDVVYLTAEDEQKLLEETKTNIMIESFDEFDVLNDQFEIQIHQLMQSLLQSSTLQAEQHREDVWKSVFWNDDNYRPDKVSSELNAQYDKLDAESKQMFKNSFSESNSFDLSAGGGIPGLFTAQTSASVSNSNANSRHTEDFARALKEKSSNVKWEGERFKPKPMSLSRVSLGNFRDGKSFQDRKISVRYSPAFLFFPIKIVEDDSGIPVIVRELRSDVIQLQNVFETCKTAIDDELLFGKQLVTQFLGKLRKRNEEPIRKVVGAIQEVEEKLMRKCGKINSSIF